MIVGALELQLMADLARLAGDMATGTGIVQKGTKKIQDMANLAGKALGLIGVSLSATAFGNWIKGAIDSADATSKMASKTGLAVAEVAGLQLAFELGGSSSEGMATAMAKLSKKMVEGDEAFDTLGISTRNTDGTMRRVSGVFYDVAAAFEDMEDGATKTALAQQIFGKSGAELLPLLNGGSEGLRQMAFMAEKLGLVIDGETAKSAEEFNDTIDLLGKGLSGMATKTMSQLLPTLNSLAGAFLDTMNEGDALAKISNALAAALKLLFSGGVVVVEVFNSIGKTIGAAGAQVVAVMKGDFKGASEIGQAYAQDVKSGWSSTAATLSKVWAESGSNTVSSLGAVVKAQKTLSLQSNEEAATSKKLAEQHAADAKKRQADYTTLTQKMLEQGAALDAEFAKGSKLTEFEKQAIEIKAKYTGAERDHLLAINEGNRGKDERNRLEEAAAKATDLAVQASAKALEQAQKDTLSLGEQIEAQRAANAVLGGAKQATEDLTIAKLLDSAASADRKAMVALERNEDTALYEELKKQAAGFRELAQLKGEGVHLKAAQEANAEWAKVTEEIGRGLTDSLFRAFEAGKGFFSTLWSGIKNTLRTTVLKVLMQPVQSGIGGMLGLASGGANAGTGGLGSLMGSLNNLGSMLGGVNNSISSLLSPAAGGLGSLMQGAGDWLTGGLGNLSTGPFADIGGWLSSTGNSLTSGAGGSMLADGMGYAGALVNLAQGKYGAAAGSAIGTYFGGPVGAAIGQALGSMADKLFAGGAGTPHMGAMYVSDAAGGYVPGDRVVGNMAWGDSVHKNFSQGVQDSLKVLTGSSAGLLNALATTFGEAGNWKVGGYWAADGHDASQGDTRIWRGSQVITPSSAAQYYFAKDGETGLKEYTANMAREVRAAMGEIDLPEWAKKQIDGLGTGATLDQMAQVVATITGTQQALKGLSDAFAPLGGVFGRVAQLGADATMELAGFAGGLDQLMAKTRSYVDAYYTVDEKNAIAAAAIQQQLAAAGITDKLGSKADLRELIDNSAVGTTAERERLAALLDIAAAFAPVGDYLEEQGKTLDALAAQAPQVALLQQQVNQQASQVNAAQQTVSAVNVVNTSIVSLQTALQAALADVGTKLDTVAAVSESSGRWIADSFSAGQGRVQP